MILRLDGALSEGDRDRLDGVLDDLELEYQDLGDTLVLGRNLSEEEIVRVGALPGVASLAPLDPGLHTVRENFLRRIASTAFVLGVLVLLAANLPVTLGPPADPLRTPSDLHPTWPLLPWATLIDRAPGWVPLPTLLLLGGLLLLFWPFVARPLAERKPWIHTAIGAVFLAAALGLGLLRILP